MEANFIDTLPYDLIVNVRSLCGSRGKAWLESLPALIADLESYWHISAGTVYPAAGINYVAPAAGANGELFVLKINPPYDNNEFVSETAYLRSRNGVASVRLMDEHTRNRALLLERAVPGVTMDKVFDGREPECLVPAIDVLRQLIDSAGEASVDAIGLDAWFGNLRRAERTAFPSEYSEKALDIYNRLGKERVMYLHGDFHPRNIVSSDRAAFLTIDPKGIVGALGYETAVFLNNFHWWQEGRADIKERLSLAIGKFADAFGLAETALREWAFAQMVLSAWWTFDEVPDEYDNHVAKADIWDV